jgi:hypothetical protein
VIDETTGATPESPPTFRSLTTKAMLHSVKPTTAFRLYSEIQVGDKIIDLLIPLKRITVSGETGLVVGQVVDLFQLNQANRNTMGVDSYAEGDDVDTRTLKGLSVVVDGERWVQQEVGSTLAQAWDSIFAGIKISQSLLLRRSA